MQLQQLQQEVVKLPPDDRLSLMAVIVESLRDKTVSRSERSSAINRLRGALRTDAPALTDDEVATMLDERRTEKYQS